VIPIDPYLLVRATSLYVALVLTAAVWVWRRPDPRSIAGAALAFVWNLPVVLILHMVAARMGWWRFDASGGMLLGMPVDLYLAWAWLWGALPALAFPTLPVFGVALVAFGFDVLLMPAAAPVLRLGPEWVVGETVGLIAALVPGQLLARWTERDERLPQRAVIQAMGFNGLLLFVLPAIAIEGSGGVWLNPLTRPAWQNSLFIQLLVLPGIVGLTAVQEFVTRGKGTPVPFDPPKALVTTGIYAYVRNPMQLASVALLFVLGLVLGNVWVSAAGMMAHICSIGLAGWDEDEDLRQRFGDAWITYRRSVRRWIPRLRPWQPQDKPGARLYVAEHCGMCCDVGRWFVQHGATKLTVVPAGTYPGTLTRITYVAGDATTAHGVEALARGLEHLHFGWAMVGFVLRLPVLCSLTQLVVDASGGEPRSVAPRPCLSDPKRRS